MIGERLGPYVIDRELGSGGMGKVYAATLSREAAGLAPGATVALKVVHPQLLETEGFFKRFLREAEIGQAVAHENVVRTLDCDQLVLGGRVQCFLVMEYVEGQTLKALQRELEVVPEELCRHIAVETCQGLAAIHAAGVVHRDMKPDNVLITPDHVVKVMDLGVARLADEALRLSQSGAFVGSVEYAAPEQFKGGDVDGRCDLHALGLVLYELAAGQHPYKADDFRAVMQRVCNEAPRPIGEVNPQLSPFFEEVVHTLLAKDRDARFDSADELLAVLEAGEDSAWWRARAAALQAATQRPLRRIRIPRETAVYGREKELARLRALYDRAASGEGQALLLEGEAGIGKSRLVDELLGRLHTDGEDVNFLFGSYPPGGASSAAGAFSTAFREHFGAAGPAAYLPQTPLLVPAFEAVLRGDVAPDDALALTKDSLATCFIQAARALGAERPTVILIDDLHFAPEDAHALFSALAMALAGDRVLLIGTLRPGLEGDWRANLQRFEHVGQMELERLFPKDLVALLRDSFQSEALASALAAQIAVKSDGNPFFAFEIIRGLREGQFITQQDDGTWVSTRVIDEIQIPSSVLDLVNARVADLTEDERALLDVAASWGYEFDPGLIGDVLGMARIPTLRAFGQIERQHRLVRSSGRQYVFDHHQVQEALYGSTNEQLREEYHAALAVALEARTNAAAADPETLDGALCVDLCEHYLKGARGASALRYLPAAQTHLEAGYLHAEMVDLTERALAVPGLLSGVERARTLLRLCGPNGPLDLLGRRPRQEKCAREAEHLTVAVDEGELRAKAAMALGVVLFRTSRQSEAEVALRRAHEIAVARADRNAESAATRSLGVVFLSRRHFPEAQGHLARSLALSREIGDRQCEAAATGSLGNVFYAQGRFPEAQQHHEQHLALSREIGHRQGEATATGNLGNVFRAQGRLREAQQHHERHLALSREIGDRQGEATATGNLGLVLRDQGRLREAQEHHEWSLALSREIGHRQGEATAIGNLGNVFYAQGRLREAQEYYERHLALSREIESRQGEAIATGNLGVVFHAQGRLREARQHFARNLALSRELGYREGEAIALHNLGTALRDVEDPTRATERLLACLAVSEETGHRHMTAATHRTLGSLHAALGDVERARESLALARDLAAEIEVSGVETLARCELACLPGGDAEDALAAYTEHAALLSPEEHREARLLLWRATGDPVHLTDARRLLDEAADLVEPEVRELMLTNLRVNREVLAAWRAEFGDDDHPGPSESATRIIT